MTLSVSSKRFQGAEEYYKSEAGNLGRKCEGGREGLAHREGRLASRDRRDDREEPGDWEGLEDWDVKGRSGDCGVKRKDWE